MPRRNARYTTQSLTGRCPPAWTQKTREEALPAITSKAMATSFITNFLAIMANHRLALPNVYVGLIQDGDAGNVDVMDFLYWLDKGLKAGKASVGYANRLSEAGAGWGEAAPDSLSEADPLDLVTVLEGLGCNVAIVDNDAADDATAGSQNGCVIVPRAGTSCTTIGGLSKSHGGSALLTMTSGVANGGYRYRFIKDLGSLNERNGSHWRFPLKDVPAIWLVRATASDHIVASENQIGITDSLQQARYVLIRGYPGEWPEVWCGSSMVDDSDPEGTCPDLTVANPTFRATTWYHNPSSTKFRHHVHWRNIWFHGKRETAGGDFVFCQRILDSSSFGSDITIRHCQFTDCQPLRPDDLVGAAAKPEYVDFAFAARTAWDYGAIQSDQDGTVIDSNYIQPAPDDYPIPTVENDGNLPGFIVSLTGTSQRFTRNRITGKNIRSPLRLNQASRTYVADNYIEAPAYKYIFAAQCNDLLIERNFCIKNGTDGYSGEGIDAGEGGTNNVIRYNVIGANEPLVDDNGCNISVSDGAGAGRNTENIHVYGNILFGLGFTLGYSSGWNDADVDDNQFRDCVFEQNVVHDFGSGNTANTTDSPVRVKIAAGVPSTPTPHAGTGSMQPELGNCIRENNITRDSGTAAIRVRISHSTSPTSDAYVATATSLPGFENNTADAVTFADAANHDFRILNDGPWREWFSADMPFNASLSKAWTPD